MSLAQRIVGRLATPPPPYRLDPRLDRLVIGLCADVGDGLVLNLGCGVTRYGRRVINLDVEPFPEVDVCGDGQRLPFRDASFAIVLLRGVLEHVPAADAVIDEVRRVLEPRGLLYVEVPFMQPYHRSPDDYRRFTLPGLRSFLHDFEELESGTQVGPGSALAWVLRESLASVLSRGSPWLYRKMLAAVGWGTFWLRYLDVLTVPAPHVAHVTSAFYFLGRGGGVPSAASGQPPRRLPSV
jgi:SAM-dependent methyltransferase